MLMPIRLRSSLQSLFIRSLLQLGDPTSRLTAAELTRSSWARPVEAYAALPTAYQGFFQPLQAQGRDFPYTLLTPAYQTLNDCSPEKLVCNLGDEIVILEQRGAACLETRFPLADITCLEARVMLLDSRIRVSGFSRQGFTTAVLRFNTVTDYLFAPLLEAIRRGAAGIPGTGLASAGAAFQAWKRQNYKLMSYARRSLLDGESLSASLLQNEIRRPLLTVLGRTYYRLAAPALAAILTDHELILIREETHRQGEAHYGGIWDFLPLSRVAALSLSEKDSSLLRLNIRLAGELRLECLVEQASRREIGALLERFAEMQPGRA
jgi:hypothetical protein